MPRQQFICRYAPNQPVLPKEPTCTGTLLSLMVVTTNCTQLFYLHMQSFDLFVLLYLLHPFYLLALRQYVVRYVVRRYRAFGLFLLVCREASCCLVFYWKDTVAILEAPRHTMTVVALPKGERKRVPTYLPAVVSYTVPVLPPHTEYLIELELGRGHKPCIVHCGFDENQGTKLQAPSAGDTGTVLFMYFSDVVVDRFVNSKWTEEVSPLECSSGKPKRICGFSQVESTLFIGLYATAAGAQNVKVDVEIGVPVPQLIDHCSIWKICRSYNVMTPDHNYFVQWYAKHKTVLTTKQMELYDGPNLTAEELETHNFDESSGRRQNIVHHILAACGDVKLLRFVLTCMSRFVDAELLDGDQRPPIFLLVMRPDIHSPHSPTYNRALQLLHLMTREAAVNTLDQDCDGNTMYHYCARYYRAGSKILLDVILVSTGGGLDGVKNNDGQTPYEYAMACQQQPGLPASQKMTTGDMMNLKKILETTKPAAERQRKTLMPETFIPDKHLPPPWMATDGSSSRTCAPEIISEAMTAEDDDDKAPIYVKKKPTTTVVPSIIMCNQQAKDFAVTRSTPFKPTTAVLDEVKLRKMFDKLDVNGNGYLSPTEMRGIAKVVENFGADFSPTQLDELQGSGKDGAVSFDEFCVMMLRLAKR